MKELSLADCYGHAGLSADSDKIARRVEPVKAISENLVDDQILDLVRFYFGIPITNDTGWFADPIIAADPSFSLVSNERELSIISMALLSHEIGVEESSFATLALLVAHAGGNRSPVIHQQFIEHVSAAAKDLSIVKRRTGSLATQIKVRTLSKDLGGSDEELVPANDFPGFNETLKKLNIDSQEMDKYLATQVTNALRPIRSELANLREEKDMLWWLIGGQSTQFDETYAEMKEGRAAYLIGAELAELSRTPLGPHASGFLIKKALREGRTEKQSKVKIGALPKLFTADELKIIANTTSIDQVRDLCFLNNALARANDMGSPTAWRKKYAEDASLSDKTQFEPSDLALQSFRETLLLKSLTA